MIALLPIGALVGLLVGGLLAGMAAILATIPLATVGFLGGLVALTSLPAILSAFAFGGPTATVIVMALLSILIVTAGGYALAAVGAGSPTPPAPTAPAVAVGASFLEFFGRGFMIGFSAALNFTIGTLIAGPTLGTLFAIITLAAAIPGVSLFPPYQTVLGWTDWLLPMSYVFFVMPLGFLVFLISAPFALAAPAPAGVRFDTSTGTIETAGGAFLGFLAGIAPTAFAGFNLGNFTFLSPGTAPTGFAAAGVSAHETGHTLNLAAFGGPFQWLNVLDQSGLRRLRVAYGELTAESHSRSAGRSFVLIW